MEYGNYFKEAFQKLSLLEQDFPIDADKDKTDELAAFIADDREAVPEEPVFDTEAENEDELQDNYVGKVIIECECCHSKFYKEPDDVIIDEETELANVDEECPFCNATMGYTIIGKIEPFDEKEPTEDEVEIDDIDVEEEPIEEVEEEEVEESLQDRIRRRHLEEACKTDESCKVDEECSGEDCVDESCETDESLTESILGDGVQYWLSDESKGDWKYISISHPELGKFIVGLNSRGPVLVRNREFWEFIRRKPALTQEQKDWLIQNTDKLVDIYNGKFASAANESLTEGVNSVEKITKKAWPHVKRYMNWYCDPTTVDEYDRYIEDGRTFDEQIAYELFEDPDAWFDPEVGIVPTGWDEDDELGEILFDAEDTLSEEDNQRLINGLVEKAKDYAKKVLTARGVKVDEKVDESLHEDFKDVSITTDDQHLEMTSDENGKVTVTTEPINEGEEDFNSDWMERDSMGNGELLDEPDETPEQEEIVPLTDEEAAEIEANSEEEAEEEETPEEEEDEFTDFGEEEFENVGESYVRRVYENVKSFKTTGHREEGDTLIVEGLITFNSGNTKKTTFTFTNPRMLKGGKVVLEGYNRTFTKTKKAFSLKGRVEDKKFITESLGYHYIAKKLNESVRVNGRVKRVLV